MSSQFTKQTLAKLAALCTQRIKALDAEVPAKTQIPVNGTVMTASKVIAIYQETLDQQAAVETLRAQYQAALLARDAAVAACQATDGALKAWVVNQYGASSTQAHDFGFPPAKARVVSSTTKAAAYQKVLATRKARNTMGKKQRLEITGVVASAGTTVSNASASPAVATPPPTPTAAH